MKIPTSRFRPDRQVGPAVALVCSLALGCRPVGAGRASWNHPAALVASWADLAKSTPTDTSLWLFSANGEDGSQHLRATVAPDSVTRTYVASTPKRYGFWYLEGALPDSAGRRICFLNWTGRSTGRCLAFVLDTIPTALGPRRRLHVHDYRSWHSVGDRVLIAREP